MIQIYSGKICFFFLVPLWSSETSLLFTIVDKNHLRLEIVARVHNDDHDLKFTELIFAILQSLLNVVYVILNNLQPGIWPKETKMKAGAT